MKCKDHSDGCDESARRFDVKTVQDQPICDYMRYYDKILSYHQRQVAFCVNAPPISGPTTDATAKVAESELVIAGLIRGLQDREIMMKQPAKTPAQPAPVTARPAMNALLFGANASYR